MKDIYKKAAENNVIVAKSSLLLAKYKLHALLGELPPESSEAEDTRLKIKAVEQIEEELKTLLTVF